MDQVFQVSGLSGFKSVLLSLSAHSREFAAAGLNNLAFAFKAEAPQVIGEHRKIRNRAFISSRFQVVKAKTGSLADMWALAGSICSPRFDGFASDYGEAVEDNKRANRSIGINARGGDMANQARPGARLMANKSIPNMSQYSGIKGGLNQRVAALISIIARSGAPNTPFILGAPFHTGLYVLTKGSVSRIKRASKKGAVTKSLTYMPKVTRLQSFDGKPKKFKRLDWVTLTNAKVQSRSQELWAQAARHVAFNN